MTMGEARDRKPELYGVGGWLAFLCVTLLIFTPLGILVEFIGTLASEAIAAEEKAFIIGFDLVMGAFTVLTGVALVRIWRNALRIAKIYFIASVCIAGLGSAAFLLIPGAGTPTEMIATVRWFLTCVLWLGYLYRSERVQNTYGPNTVRDAAEVFR
jgi:hypothetical protein